MRSLKFGFAALTISAGLIMACNAQPPGDRKGPPPQWNPVHLFPPDIRESLNLTEQQEKQIDDLEKEVRGKVDKILTAQQRKILSEARPRAARVVSAVLAVLPTVREVDPAEAVSVRAALVAPANRRRRAAPTISMARPLLPAARGSGRRQSIR